MIFICLTPSPKGEHLKIIELDSPTLWGLGGQWTFWSGLITSNSKKFQINLFQNLIFIRNLFSII